MKIIVIISTIDEGLRGVPQVMLPEEEGVKYVVVWQRTGIIETLKDTFVTERGDVVLETMEGKGLCRSRNRGIEVAMGLLADPLEDAVFVIADDDERLEPGVFQKLRTFYQENSRLDVALMRVRTEDGWLKRYPAGRIDFRKRERWYYPSSVEMTFRSRVAVMGLRFDERFGLGSERLCAGEEEVFLGEAVKKGLRVQIVPEVLASTSAQTTGRRVLDVKVLRSKGAVYGYQLPLWRALLRSLREAVSLAVRNKTRLMPIFRNIWYGVKYIRAVEGG